jgi:hypothetical protein
MGQATIGEPTTEITIPLMMELGGGVIRCSIFTEQVHPVLDGPVRPDTEAMLWVFWTGWKPV